MSDATTHEDHAMAQRRHEEQSNLINHLRESLRHLAEDNNDLREYNATLKKAQSARLEQLAEQKTALEHLVNEKSELAGENARLHVHVQDATETEAQLRYELQQLQEEAEGYRAAEAAIAASLEAADGEEKPDDTTGPAGSTDETAKLRQQVKSLRALLYRVSRAAAASGMEPALWMDGTLVQAGGLDTRRIEQEAQDTRRDIPRGATGVSTEVDAAAAAAGGGAAGSFHEGTDALAMHRARLDRRLLGNQSTGSARDVDPRTREKPSERKAVARETLSTQPPPRDGQRASGSLGGVVGWIVSPPVILARVLATAADAVFGEDDDADDPLEEPARPVLEL